MIKIGEKRIPMQEQPVEKRIRNFHSVHLGYTEEEAIAEAQRCNQCKNAPCEQECPVNMEIKAMILAIADGNFKKAFFIAKKDNAIPAMAGRVCPQEEQCEGVCPLALGGEGNGINIGKLAAFVADWARKNGIKVEFHIEEQPEKIAIIGAGPAGISCAVDLRRFGYQVTVFEALHMAGGVTQYGIPAFRLPKDIVDYELAYLTEIGVDIKLNKIVGQNVKFQNLLEEFDAIFVGTGAGAPRFMGIDGEKFKGVYSANEFLIRVNLMKSYSFPIYDTPVACGDVVGVIGAGNVTMDSARCALRLGAKKVFILYRRTKKEAPARDEEIEHALEEGIILDELVNPKRVIGSEDGWVVGVEMIKMELGEPDSSGRARPVPVEGSEYTIELDTLIEAIGTKPNRLFLDKTPELQTTSWNTVEVDENLLTNIESVYAGGDAIRGGATVILALGDGRKAAHSIHDYIQLMKPIYIHKVKVAKELYYSEWHTWIKVTKDNTVKIGLDDFSQKLLGKITKVELPKVGDIIAEKGPAWKVRSDGWGINLLSPIAGEVIAVNQKLSEDCSSLNEDPYKNGWVLELKPDKLEEKTGLMLFGEKAVTWFEEEFDVLHSQVKDDIGVTIADGGELVEAISEKIDRDEWQALIGRFLMTEPFKTK